MYKCLKLLDPVVICPYDKNHLISKSRLQKHIVKCENNYPEHYKVMCPFNATHRLFKSELEEHIVTCPTRSVLESEMYPDPGIHKENCMLQSEISSTIDCTENWDLEVDDSSKIFSEEEYAFDNNSDTFKKTLDSENNVEKENLRAPRGFSEAMLKEANEESCVEDGESVISSMGIGRGKIIQEKDRLKMIGLGRGRPLNTN
ncbi:uncharacterized protein LOC143184418 [Calliopsis andreniformis]|uniref:uncharacterized protein LOC143184418 n=1 Tax=Calliopsis andreniformis TaxID=337506 RepID=UPI003FCD9C05